MEPIYSPRWEADLQSIWNFIADHSPLNADRFIGELLTVANRLADSPRIGRPRPKLRRGVRSFPQGNYIVLYEVVGNRVRILPVVHGARRITRRLLPD